MKSLESAPWRSYRGHLIIERPTLLRGRRYDVFRDGHVLGTFRDVVAAELYIDSTARERIEVRSGH